MIDSLFTPIRNVGMRIEDVRVGQQTNYNRVVLDIETDGTLTGQEAVAQTTKILIQQLEAISTAVAMGGTHASSPEHAVGEAEAVVIDDQVEDAYVGNDEVVAEAPVVEITEEETEGDDADKKKRGRPRK